MAKKKTKKKKNTKASGKEKAKKKGKKSVSTNVAKDDKGNIQITFTIPFEKIEKEREKAAKELGKNTEVPGFRKGKAPLKKLLEHLPENTLLESTLSRILPNLVGDAINEHDLKLASYPRFELIKAKEGEDWQVRATTAEIPDFSLGDYKKAITGELRAKSLWSPGKDKKKEGENEAATRQEREQAAIKALLDNVELSIPDALIESEVNARLSRLMEKLDKLGLELDSYLASAGKTAEKLREEHEKQAEEAIKLDLILNKIADEEGVEVKKEEIDEAIKASSADQKLSEELNTPERRRLVESVLRKRKALNSLTSIN